MGSSDSRPLNAKSSALDVMEYFAVERGQGQRFLEGKTAVVTVSAELFLLCQHIGTSWSIDFACYFFRSKLNNIFTPYCFRAEMLASDWKIVKYWHMPEPGCSCAPAQWRMVKKPSRQRSNRWARGTMLLRTHLTYVNFANLCGTANRSKALEDKHVVTILPSALLFSCDRLL